MQSPTLSLQNLMNLNAGNPEPSNSNQCARHFVIGSVVILLGSLISTPSGIVGTLKNKFGLLVNLAHGGVQPGPGYGTPFAIPVVV